MIYERGTYSIDEAAARLGIGRTLARRLAREGALPGVFRIGSAYRVSSAVVEQILATGTTIPTPAGKAAQDEGGAIS